MSTVKHAVIAVKALAGKGTGLVAVSLQLDAQVQVVAKGEALVSALRLQLNDAIDALSKDYQQEVALRNEIKSYIGV